MNRNKLTKNFEFPFSIGKHLLTLVYNSKETDLRIDSNSFKNLYSGAGLEETGPTSLKPQYPASRPNYPAPSGYPAVQKKVPDEWVDIKNAKTNIKYDNIPDPYADMTKKQSEEVKNTKTLETVGRTQKSQTIVKKQQIDPFAENLGDSKPKKSDKTDEFDFDFGGQGAKKPKSDAFDFDAFGQNLKSTSDKPKQSSDWSTGLVFDSFQSEPKKNQLDDIFGGGMLEPKADTANSNNPFDMFSGKTEPKKKENPFVSNDIFGSSTTTQGSSATSDPWGSAFTSAFPTSTGPTYGPGMYSQPPLFSKPASDPVQKSNFAHLNPFSSAQNTQSKNAGGNLPPGVNSSDLFS